MQVSAAEHAVLDALDAAAILRDTEMWSAINSGSRNLDGLARMAGLLGKAFTFPGADARLVDAAPVSSVGPDGERRAVLHGQHLHVVLRPEAPMRVLLTGHMDTVFGVEHPFQTCRWLNGNTLNGPGTADMKGGLAVMRAAIGAVLASPLSADLGIEVVIVSDEEVGSPSSAALLAAAAWRCHLGLTYEPALPDGTLAGARKGSGNFSAVVRGRAAHAGREIEAGRNALLAASDLALRLAALMTTHPGVSVNPAKIDGGGPNNIVPDLAVLRFNVRPATLDQQMAITAAIDAAIVAVAAAHNVTIALDGGFGRPPKPLDANQLRLFELVRTCGADLDLDIGWRDTGGVCDGNNLAATGLAVVDTLGPRGGSIHSADEFLCVDSLLERARLSTLLLLRVAQSGWSRAPAPDGWTR